jgi:prepilin peptidase CpaA
VFLVCGAAIGAAGLVAAAGGTRGFFLPTLAALVCVAAAVFDASTGRIPNRLTYTALLLGLGLNAVSAALPLVTASAGGAAVTWLGGPGLASSLWGFAACAGLGLLGAAVAGVHGGDLKLLAAVGAMLGLAETGNVLLVALLVALAYSVLNLLAAGRLNTVLRLGAARAMELVYTGRAATGVPDDGAPADATHIPMAVPLAAGLLVAQYWQWRTGGFIL